MTRGMLLGMPTAVETLLAAAVSDGWYMMLVAIGCVVYVFVPVGTMLTGAVEVGVSTNEKPLAVDAATPVTMSELLTAVDTSDVDAATPVTPSELLTEVDTASVDVAAPVSADDVVALV